LRKGVCRPCGAGGSYGINHHLLAFLFFFFGHENFPKNSKIEKSKKKNPAQHAIKITIFLL